MRWNNDQKYSLELIYDMEQGSKIQFGADL